MRIGDQVCTLEQARRLKDLGVVQESYHYYLEEDGSLVAAFGYSWNDHPGYVTEPKISAFTVAELGVLLGNCAVYKNYEGSYTVRVKTPDDTRFVDRRNEAEARAEMLIHLLENNYITVEEINPLLQQQATTK